MSATDDDPADWREAVDANSGKTYYYHRKTRVSSWEKPLCLQRMDAEDDEEVEDEDDDHFEDLEPAQESLMEAATAAINGISLNSLAYEESTNAATKIISEEKQRHFAHNSPSKAESIYPASTTTAPQNVTASATATLSSSDNLVCAIISKMEMVSPKDARSKDLQTLLSNLTLPVLEWTLETTHLLSSLVNIIVHNSSKISRQYALRCLWSMSSCRIFNAQYFHSEQSWPVLFDHVLKWEDPESVILLGSIASNLLVGPTKSLITDQAKYSMCLAMEKHMSSGFSSSTVDMDMIWASLSTAPSSLLAPCVTDARVLQALHVVAVKGQQVAAQVLLTLCDLSLRSSKYAVLLLQRGVVPMLLSIAAATNLPKQQTQRARGLVLRGLERSSYCRESIVDALLDTVSDGVSGVGYRAMGPHPSLYQPCFLPSSKGCSAEDQDALREVISAAMKSSAAATAGAGGGASSLEEDAVANAEAEQLIPDMIELGYFDIDEVPFVHKPRDMRAADDSASVDEATLEAELLQTSLQRDIELIPSRGTSWRMNSVLMWNRCPALRDLIERFWDGGGGGLDISVDACDEVLAIVCAYMHTGSLIGPCRVVRKLELVRVSLELGMIPLYELACADVVRNLDGQSVHVVRAFADTFELVDLQQQSQMFLSSGRIEMAPIDYSPSGSAVGEAGATPASSGHDGSSSLARDVSRGGGDGLNGSGNLGGVNGVGGNNGLRDAIFASLHDVSAALSEVKPAAATASSLQQGHHNNNSNTSSAYTHEQQYQQHHHQQQQQQHSQAQRQQYTINEDLYGGTGGGPILLPQDAGRGGGLKSANNNRTAAAGGGGTGTGTGAHTSSSKSGKPAGGKPKSGGIYGLLLQQQAQEEEEQAYQEQQMRLQQQQQQSHVVSGNSAGRMPGKVMGERQGGIGSSGGGFGSSSPPRGAGGNKAPLPASAAFGASPNTVKATNILAGARPGIGSGGSSALDDYDANDAYSSKNDEYGYGDEPSQHYDYDSNVNTSGEAEEYIRGGATSASSIKAAATTGAGGGFKSKLGTGAKTVAQYGPDGRRITSSSSSSSSSSTAAGSKKTAGGGGQKTRSSGSNNNGSSNGSEDQPREYSSSMTLEPTKEPSEKEKRLNSITRPRLPPEKAKALAEGTAKSKTGASAVNVSVDMSADDDDDDAKESLQQQPEKRMFSPKRPPGRPKNQVQAGGGGSTAMARSVDSANSGDDQGSAGELRAPQRSISPTTSSKNNDLTSVLAPATAVPDSSSLDNVRGSLALLKNKASASRRRRSVMGDASVSGNGADGPDQQQQQQQQQRARAQLDATDKKNDDEEGEYQPFSAAPLPGAGAGAGAGAAYPSASSTHSRPAATQRAPPAQRRPPPPQVEVACTRQSGCKCPDCSYSSSSAAAAADDDDDDAYDDQYEKQQQQQQQARRAVPPVQRSTSGLPPRQQPVYDTEPTDEGRGGGGGGPQHECPDCGRRFNEEPFQRHVKICSKVFIQKRKAFDSAKMRIEAIPELKEIQTPGKKRGGASVRQQQVLEKSKSASTPSAGGSGGTPNKWKEQSNAFREAMKAARDVNAALAKGEAPPAYKPSAPDPSLMPCPHCGRTFSQKAGERHIPQCQNIKAKPTSLKRGVGGGGGINGKGTPATPGAKSRGQW